VYDKIITDYYFVFKEKILADFQEKTNSKVRINLKTWLPLPPVHVYWAACGGASNSSDHPPVMCGHFQRDLASCQLPYQTGQRERELCVGEGRWHAAWACI